MLNFFRGAFLGGVVVASILGYEHSTLTLILVGLNLGFMFVDALGWVGKR